MPYEYKTITFNLLELTEDELNRLGQEGWKLTGLLPIGTSAAKLIFVRKTMWIGTKFTGSVVGEIEKST